MTARAIVFPGSFGDTSLPKISLDFARPLANALLDCAVESLSAGPVTTWESSVGGSGFSVAEGSPTVSGTGAAKVIRFNGTTDRMQAPLAISTPHTVVAVFRYLVDVGDSKVFTGLAGDGEGAVKNTPTKNNLGIVVGAASLSGNPPIVTDTGWHVVIASFAAGASSLRYDTQDTTGSLATPSRTGIMLGHGPSATGFKQNIEYKRLAVLGGATTLQQRSALVSYLKQRYGI